MQNGMNKYIFTIHFQNFTVEYFWTVNQFNEYMRRALWLRIGWVVLKISRNMGSLS